MSMIRPKNYRIHLEPDLERFEFLGRAEILLEARQPVSEVTLDSLDLDIIDCVARAGGELLKCSCTLDAKEETLSVSFPLEISGEVEILIDYRGKINAEMQGFYRSTTSVQGQEKIIAVTQFEESDARRAFPCLDHPSQKATFEIEIVVGEGLSAISNTPVSEKKGLGAGRQRVRFEKTPCMSTYLVFFGIGEFEFIEEPGDVLLRVAGMPGTAGFGRMGMDFAKKCLDFCEQFFGIAYPLAKLDLIAVADFAAGAMENWGAITFRENLLLYDPELASRADEERICEVIAHEIAHQWFGNLVTPSDWKYLWLNESFATYFAYGVVNHYRPEWDVWDQFLIGQTRVAMDRDALHETFPIELPGGEHVVINASTAPIIYNKGASILMQVEAYVGREKFKKGLQQYLKAHAYACASSHDLWDALEAQSEKPVSRLMEGWIEQSGFPLVDVRREDDKLIIAQERFTFLPEPAGGLWPIPLEISAFLENGEIRHLSTLLETGEGPVDLGLDVLSYKVNAGQKGFYRVRYRDPENLRALGEMAAQKRLSPQDRWGVLDDLYAMVQRGDVSVPEYLDFLDYFVQEEAFLPLTSMASNLFHIRLVMGKDIGKRAASLGRALFERVLGEIGYDPGPDESQTTSVLREQILWHSLVYGSGEAEIFALGRFRALKEGQRVHPDLLKSAMRAGAFLGGREAFDWFGWRFNISENEHERMNILWAMGCFRDRKSIEAVQAFVMDKVPSRNRFIPVGALGANPWAAPLMWDWYVSNQGSLESLHPVHYERVIEAVVPFGGLGREDEVRDYLKAHMQRTDKAGDVIRLSLERLAINAGMRHAGMVSHRVT
ncbi:MAG: M1 family metallopeptidase [Desulfatiglandales bacterium]